MYHKLFENSTDPIYTETSLFLTHLATTGFGKLSKQIIQFLSSIIWVNNHFHGRMQQEVVASLKDLPKKKFILDFLRNADAGIEDLVLGENSFDGSISDLYQNNGQNMKQFLISSRKRFNAEQQEEGSVGFLLDLNESEGTKKLLELSPLFYNALKEGTPLFIDEFDAKFHPLLTKRIVELFNSSENKNAQLIFVTHDTNLLSADLLRRDQIDFVEKDKYGASHLYSLAELKGVRNDASYEKDYIQGKYGAIPFLGDFKNLIAAE